MFKYLLLLAAILVSQLASPSIEPNKSDNDRDIKVNKIDFKKIIKSVSKKTYNIRGNKEKDLYDEKLIETLLKRVPLHLRELDKYDISIDNLLVYQTSLYIIQLGNRRGIIDKYVDYRWSTRDSANESFSVAIAEVFLFYPVDVSRAISKRTRKEQRYIIDDIVLGILNKISRYLSRDNYMIIYKGLLGNICINDKTKNKVTNIICSKVKKYLIDHFTNRQEMKRMQLK